MGTPVLPERHQGHVPCAAQIMAHHLQPALEWAREHRGALVASSGEQAVAAFEFRLHRLQFLHLLQTQGGAACLCTPCRPLGLWTCSFWNAFTLTATRSPLCKGLSILRDQSSECQQWVVK